MKRWITPIVTGLMFLGAAGLVALERSSAGAALEEPSSDTVEDPPTSEPIEPTEEPKPEPVAELPTKNATPAPGSFDYMPDGTAVPGLPKDAPKRVRIGVALFRYEGAEGSGASSRSRDEALALAEKAIAAGAEDFSAAVKLGDPGSTKDVGWISRGILELSLEYAAFSLAKGELRREPLDAPTGVWVIRRVR